ncbi:MAG: hypothetical protein ABI625_11470 [bacterium]
MTSPAHFTKARALTSASLTYPPNFQHLPDPLALPWSLKPVWSADFGVDRLPGGAIRYWIRH